MIDNVSIQHSQAPLLVSTNLILLHTTVATFSEAVWVARFDIKFTNVLFQTLTRLDELRNSLVLATLGAKVLPRLRNSDG